MNISQRFLLTGCLLWIAGFFLAVGEVYPYSLFLIYASPALLLLGIMLRIINYIKTNKRLPNLFQYFDNFASKNKEIGDSSAAQKKILSLVLYFWLFCIVFWMSLSFFGTTLFKRSHAFATTKKYIEADPRLFEKIGTVKYYGFLIGGSISSTGSADLSFTVIGEKGISSVQSILKDNKVIHVNYQ